MFSYDVLTRLREALSGHAEAKTNRAYRECWLYSAELVAAIESDLTAIAGGNPRVAQLGFHLCDPDHHGADTYHAIVRYDDWDVFRVDVVALINHGIIRVSVRRRPNDARFERIANILDVSDEVHLRDYPTSAA